MRDFAVLAVFALRVTAAEHARLADGLPIVRPFWPPVRCRGSVVGLQVGAEALDTWATGPVGTSGLRHAAAFVLSVWSVPANVAATVRKQLCREILGVLEGCDQRAYQAEETAPPLLRRRIDHARQKALFAWRSYQLGQLADAREAAAAAASLDEVYAPLARSLLADGGPLSKPEVLQMLAEAEVWRVGAFNAGAALAVWDANHRDAFLTWARAPWYC